MAFTLLELDYAPFFLNAVCNMPHTTTMIDLVIQSRPSHGFWPSLQSDAYHESKAEIPSYESLA